MSQDEVMCPKCQEWFRKLTKHHVYPVAHFGRKNNEIVHLCWDCHEALHKLLGYDKRPREEYVEILIDYLEVRDVPG